jgi:hypothetical protein
MRFTRLNKLHIPHYMFLELYFCYQLISIRKVPFELVLSLIANPRETM